MTGRRTARWREKSKNSSSRPDDEYRETGLVRGSPVSGVAETLDDDRRDAGGARRTFGGVVVVGGGLELGVWALGAGAGRV